MAAPIAPGTFVVAHRAGNDLARLRTAEALGIPLVEADVRLFAGRLEVRHLKSVGPLPLFWDRRELAPPWTAWMRLEELLDARGPDTELMLDLKGRNPRVGTLVAAALRAADGRQPVTVCSQDWTSLAAVRAGADVRIVHSVGSARALDRLRRRAAGDTIEGVSIHRKLLDPEVVAELRALAGLVMSWPVRSEAQASELSGWGVRGLISSEFERLAPALAGLRAAA